MAAAARAFPDWRFRLAGKVEDPEVAALAGLPNLETVGEIPFADVAGFLAGLDVALVPFRDLPLTRAVDPVKLYEALAMGLPVVARRLPETERWAEPLVYLYDGPDDFVRQVRRAIAERGPEAAARAPAGGRGGELGPPRGRAAASGALGGRTRDLRDTRTCTDVHGLTRTGSSLSVLVRASPC